MKNIELYNKVQVPSIGFGTWRLAGDEAYQTVKNALKIGYRHIDTAAMYGNEVEIGRAIKDSNIPREDLFITTKLWNSEQGYDSTIKSFEESLKKLDLDYIDLYLIHWPQTRESELASWKAMEEIYSASKARAIGVSNFNFHHLQNIIENCKIIPMVNQIECNISIQNHKLQEFCAKNGIVLEAYAPMMSQNVNDLLTNPELQEISKNHQSTPAQVALNWLVSRNIIALPKSKTEKYIKSNIDIFDFELSHDELVTIRKMNTGVKAFPDPDNIDF